MPGASHPCFWEPALVNWGENMIYTKRSLSLKSRLVSASALGAAVSGALFQAALAQAPDRIERNSEETEGPATEQIVVVGSYIRQDGFDARTPLQVVGLDDIREYGATQLVDVLRAVPSNTGSLIYSEFDNTAGTAQFNLRGLSLSSTLTLVNGRRAGVAPVADATGADFLDINQFPIAMIERVEILKDGASAIYGSEAVAGVVNLVTRKGFEGFEVSGEYQDASNQAYTVSMVAGAGFDRGSFNLYATYYGQTRNDRLDFDWLDERINGNGVEGRSRLISSTGSPGTYRPGFVNADGEPEGVPGGVNFADPDCEAAGGIFRIRDDGSVDTSVCRHSFANQYSPILAADRLQAFAEFDYQLTDRIRYFTEASASRNVTKGSRGPENYLNGPVVDNNPGNIFIPGDHPFNFFIADPGDPQALVYIGPENWDPAIHTAVPVVAQARPLGSQFNGNDDVQLRREFNYFRMMNGLDIELSDTWQANVSHSYATSNMSETIPFNYRTDILTELINDGEFNPFGTSIANPDLISPKDGVSTARNEEETLRRFLTTEVANARTTQQVIDGLVTGTAFEPKSGPINVALGAQYREVTLNDDPDSLLAAGEARTSNLAFSIDAEQDVWAVFGEAVIPFYDIAQLQVAVRHEDYGGSVGATTDPKISMRINPTDWLLLRGSWGTSFQAPTIRQTSSSFSLELLDDPASVGANGLECVNRGLNNGTIVNVEGADDLKPQSADNFSVGAVLSGKRGPRISIDYWNYDYVDLIARAEGAQAIVINDCLDDGIPNDPRIIRDGAGQLIQVNTAFTNIGEVQTDGIDVELAYPFSAGALGELELRAAATYINSFDVADGANEFSGAGSRNFLNNFSPAPKWRGNFGGSWRRGNHAAVVTVRYIDSYLNDQSNNARIDSYTTVDAQYSLDLDGLFRGAPNASITVGADNIFDVDPPALVRNDSTGARITGTISDIDRPSYDPLSGVDIRGRLFYIRARHQF